MTLVERLLTAETSVRTSRSLESRRSPADAEDEAPAVSHRGSPRSDASSNDAESRWSRLRRSVWFPVASKAAGTIFLLLGLAGIGAWAVKSGPAGHRVPLPEPGSASSPWIATQAGALPAPSPPAPRAAPTPAASSGAGGASQAAPSAAVLADGRVVLNLATADDLRKIPGVGQKRAEAILALRAKLGGKFRRFTDLMRVRGIGPKRLKQMMPRMVLDPPAEAAAKDAGAPSPAP